MRPINLLSIWTFTFMGCGQLECADADCGVDPSDGLPYTSIGLEEAKQELQDRGVRLPEDADTIITRSIEDRLHRDCDVIAIMATVWGNGTNDFDGVIIGTKGEITADVDGRFAHHRADQGVFAGGYTGPTDEISMETIGGVYRGDHSFSGAVSRGGQFLPVRGMWQQTTETGGFALGLILACDDRQPTADPRETRKPSSD